MSSFSHFKNGWNILSKSAREASRTFFLALLIFLSIGLAPLSHAIVDVNQNGLSDLWEKANNGGQLFDATFDAQSDSDGDGWKNSAESTAGTNPFSANPSTGYVNVRITHVPAVYTTPTNGSTPILITPESHTVEWPTLIGKQYTLQSSALLSGDDWITVGYPILANGNLQSMNITASLVGGGRPEKLFWRVAIHDRDNDFDTLTNYEESLIGSSPYAWDSDGDTIGDAAEYNIHGTNLRSRDTDSDGVSDKDEILVNFTNPKTTISAYDADSDGIPDDHEKHLAKQFLVTSTRVTPGDARHTALLVGDLDPNFDYTGDGMSAFELATALKENVNLFNSGESLIFERKTKSFHIYEEKPVRTIYTYSSANIDAFRRIVFLYPSLPNTNAGTLLTEIENADWITSTNSVQSFPYNIMASLQSGFSKGSTPFESNQGHIEQTQYRVKALRADHPSYFQRLLEVNTRGQIQQNGEYLNLSTHAEPKSVALPVGQFFTPWVNLEALPVVEDEYAGTTVFTADIDFVNTYLYTTYLPDEEQEDRDFGGLVGLSKVINGVEQTPLAEFEVRSPLDFPWRLQFNSDGRYKVYSPSYSPIYGFSYSYLNPPHEIVSEQLNTIPSERLNPRVTMAIQGLAKSATPGQERISMQVQMNGAWIEIDAINFTVGVPMETKYVDRDDPTKTWSTSGEPKSLPENQPIYAGKDTGDLVSWSLPNNILPGSTFTWSAERKTPASPAITITGVTGIDKTEWKLTSPIDWRPGIYKIKCSITKNGTTIPLEFEQRVGVRTDDVVVVGWIDPQPIVLNTAGVQAGLFSILPTLGLSSESGDNAKIKAALLVKHISEVGVGSPFQIDLGPIMDGTDFAAFTAADKTYALRWMFKYGSNSAPPADFANDSPPAIPGVTSMMDQSELANFVAEESLANFKLINHYQVKYLTAADGKFDPATVTYPPNKKQVWIGSTRDPAHLHTISGLIDWAILVGAGFNGYPRATGIFPGEPGPNNWVRTDTATETKLCNEGRPDAKAMAAFANLAGTPAAFHIWSSISFFPNFSSYSETISPSTGASLTRDPKPNPFHQGRGRINTQIYPTYWIYINGVKSPLAQSQHPDPAVLIPNTDQCQ